MHAPILKLLFALYYPRKRKAPYRHLHTSQACPWSLSRHKRPRARRGGNCHHSASTWDLTLSSQDVRWRARPHRSGHAWCLSQGDDNVLLPQPARGHARTTFIQKGIHDFATLHTWCVDAQFKSRWQSKELFLSLISEHKCVCIPSRSEFLDILLRLDQRLGLGIQFWCGTTALSGSPPDRAEIITKNNDQNITTYYASYPFFPDYCWMWEGAGTRFVRGRYGLVRTSKSFRLTLFWVPFGLNVSWFGVKPNRNKQTNKQTKQNKTNKQTNKHVNAALKHK